MAKHEHEFTLLYSHFGQYGPQDVHLHYCFGGRCSEVIIGEGRSCHGKKSPHRQDNLNRRSAHRAAEHSDG